ncbi:unnamed protein product [Ectocarpus sp. CCAP 1310/34]|nr:unnamed protein product [Ectocarpus sp. CCAP 1310/34]
MPLADAVFASMLPVAVLWSTVSRPAAWLCGKDATSPLPPDVDLSGKVMIVTGANTGIGNRTAFNLAKAGAKVIMACRSLERGESARQQLEEEMRETLSKVEGGGGAFGTRQGTLEVMKCDLSELESVRTFAREFKAKHGDRLDVLVNNAGVGITDGPRVTADGLDLVFGVNFVGHFCLTNELLPLIQSTPGARVVCLSSVMHHSGGTKWESAVMGHPKRRGATYADSKLAMVIFAKELKKRFAVAGSSATAVAVNPGAVRSDIWRNVPKLVMPVFDLFMRFLFLTSEQGSYTSVRAAALPLETLSGSGYYQPYWMPFKRPFPFEVFGPFVGCAPGRPKLVKDEPAATSALWTTCERVIEAARAARGDAPGASRG